MAYCKINHLTERSYESIAFNAVDAKGRKMGAEVMTNTREAVEGEGPCVIEPGIWFVAVVQATKDGEEWGASQGAKFFRTEVERQAFIDRRVSDMRKKSESK